MDLRGEWHNGARSPEASSSAACGTPISWHLGDHLSNSADVSRVTERSTAGRTETVYDLTEETYLVQTRTPVGRERYREVPKRDLELDHEP
ncbi:hypothetical protein [Haladaptatus sp. CMAA 1911]|uniref:hypothetical protein n=1 Tax=unclassified Haladaptatus TaxID=2622732 RepID=UPI003754EEC6